MFLRKLCAYRDDGTGIKIMTTLSGFLKNECPWYHLSLKEHGNIKQFVLW